MAKTAHISYNEETGKYEAVITHYNKPIVVAKSANPDYIRRSIENGIGKKIAKWKVTDYTLSEELAAEQNKVTSIKAAKNTKRVAQTASAAANLPEYTPKQRMEVMRKLVQMTIKGVAKSVLITGKGGIGKTFTVTKALKDAGLYSSDEVEEEEADYVVIKGKVSTKAVFEMMYRFRDKIILFDDCRSILEDKTAVELLKGALDSYERRIVTWGKSDETRRKKASQKSEDDEEEFSYPEKFEFTGKIVFISNLMMEKLDQALRSRSLCVDLTMTNNEVASFIGDIIHNILPEYSMGMKKEVLSFIKERIEMVDTLSIRHFLNACHIRAEFPDDWKIAAEYTLVTADAA